MFSQQYLKRPLSLSNQDICSYLNKNKELITAKNAKNAKKTKKTKNASGREKGKFQIKSLVGARFIAPDCPKIKKW